MVNVDKKELGRATYTYYWSEYSSLRELVTDIESRPMNEEYVGTASHKKECDGWSGVKSYEDARERLFIGDQAFASSVIKELRESKVVTSQTSSRMKTCNNYYGYAPNVAAAIAGMPKAMRCKKRVPIKTKVVNLVYSPTCPARIDSKDILKAGKEFVKVVNTLEAKGFRVNIDLVVFCGKEANKRAVSTVEVKRASQPLNLAKMGWVLAAPSVFRRVGFRWLESCPIDFPMFNYGIFLTSDDFTIYKKSFKKNATYIVAMDIIDSNFDVMTVLKQQGLILD